MTYVHRFTVEGSGSFPLDMLRYDGCYPRDSNAVSHMISKEPRQIDLTTVMPGKDWQPTSARWSSFGWSVARREPPYKI